MEAFFAHLLHTAIRTSGLPMSVSTSVVACRSTRRPRVRWCPFNRSSAVSGAPTSTVAGESATREGETPHANRKGESMSDPQPIITLFQTLLDAATKIGLTAAALFLAWAGFLYMTAGGRPPRMERLKEAAIASNRRLAVLLTAKSIAH